MLSEVRTTKLLTFAKSIRISAINKRRQSYGMQRVTRTLRTPGRKSFDKKNLTVVLVSI